MYTIVGLGNPGGAYAKNRHNTGRILAGMLAEKHGIELKAGKKPDLLAGTGEVAGEKVRILLPDTYMNRSGSAVGKFIKTPAAAKKLVVVYDDIDLPLGRVRVSFGSSSGGHNGVRSVERAAKTKSFVKIRVGVSKAAGERTKKPNGTQAVIDHLLSNFTKAEMEKISKPVRDRVFLAIEIILETNDPVLAMNAVNGLR